MAGVSSLGEWRHIYALGSSAAGWKAEAAGHEPGSDYLVCVEARQPDDRIWRWRNEHRRAKASHDRRPRTLAPFVLEGASDQIAIAPKSGRLAYVLQNLDTNIWRLPLDRTRTKDSPCAKAVRLDSRGDGSGDLTRREVDRVHLEPFRATGTCGRGTRMAPGCMSWRRNRFCHSIPHGRRTAVKSPSIPRRPARVRSGWSSAAGGPPRRLVAMPGGAQVPSWSRDGKRVLFYTNAEGSRQIWEVPAAGGTPVQLTREGIVSTLRNLRMGATSITAAIVCRNLAYPARAPVARMEAWRTSSPELIRETLPVTGHRFWALGQGGIYFVDAQKTPAVLKLVDLASHAK